MLSLTARLDQVKAIENVGGGFVYYAAGEELACWADDRESGVCTSAICALSL